MLLMLAMLVWVAVWCRAFRRDLEPAMTALLGAPPARPSRLDALTWLVLLVMLAPIIWLVISSLQDDLELATGAYDLLHPTLDAFTGMWQTVDFERYFLNSLVICTGRGAAGDGVRELGRLRARPLPVPRRAAVRADRDRHAADPGLDVPAAAVRRLHLAQAERRRSRSTTPTSG